MLQLRVLCPPERTDHVLRAVRADAGVAHVVVSRGAAVEPEGDVVEAYLTRESADAVLDAIDATDLARVGAVVLTDAGTTLSEAAERAEAAVPGEPDDAVVWDELVARTGEESRLNGTFLAFLSLACLLAAVGAVTDSAVTVVGAMVVGPEFGPLAALAVGAVVHRWDLVRRAALALATGFPLAMVITAGATLLGEAAGLISTASL